MKTKVKLTMNLVEWNLIPAEWNLDSYDFGIKHRRYYFLCFKFEIYKIIKK